ncbi:hypothetical protein [Algoriphagus taiwanensis]|uniref:Outer membrane protein beta-barrel domain-containing protein n=1 Tax=Algoriphagus taiwanensis TaxID=1445656 RepID=A0ABQ6PZV8_9BACT|nr:hypothetical protein Ataiwa_17280 [Algoriphagus taiwanensis]
MKIRTFCLLICLFFSYVSTLAQEKIYFTQNEIGLLFGKGVEQWDGSSERRVDFTLQSFHGAWIGKKQVIGFSLGLDQYEDISLIPLAMGWRGFLGKSGGPQFFGGLDLGASTALLEKKVKTEWQESWYEGGAMVSPIAGVRFPSRKGKSSLSFSFAYKRQELTYFEGTLNGGGITLPDDSGIPPGFNSLFRNESIFHSLVFRAGLMF